MSFEETLTTVVVTASSVDEAIILGLTRLVATRDEVEIEVLDEGSRGFLGIGAREARVQVSRRAQAATPSVPTAVVPQPKPDSVTFAPPLAAASPEPEPMPKIVESKPVPPQMKAAAAPATPQIEAKKMVEATPPAEKPAATPEPVAPAKPAPKLTPVKLQEKPRAERPSAPLDRALVEKTALEVAENLFAGFNIQCSVS